MLEVPHSPLSPCQLEFAESRPERRQVVHQNVKIDLNQFILGPQLSGSELGDLRLRGFQARGLTENASRDTADRGRERRY